MARLRIFRAVTDAGAETAARKHLAELLVNARIDAEIHVVVARTHPDEFIPEHSGTTADIVMLGLSTVDMEQFPSTSRRWSRCCSGCRLRCWCGVTGRRTCCLKGVGAVGRRFVAACCLPHGLDPIE